MLARARQIHAATRKPRDILWNRAVARPLASLALTGLERTRVTPNQITLASLALFLVAGGLLVALPGAPGLWAGVLVLQVSYVLDCADGQLARLRASPSAVGAHLDFTVDTLKALWLIAAIATRLSFAGAPGPLAGWPWLLEGTLGLVAAGFGLTLTTFVRRPEYRAATGAPVHMGAGDYRTPEAAQAAAPEQEHPARAAPWPLRAILAGGQFILHYPSHILAFAIADRLDLMLHVYLAAHAAHAGRTLAQVVWRLGWRPRPVA